VVASFVTSMSIMAILAGEQVPNNSQPVRRPGSQFFRRAAHFTSPRKFEICVQRYCGLDGLGLGFCMEKYWNSRR
jgi:hypothetical protein